jgi:hypothetical protein
MSAFPSKPKTTMVMSPLIVEPLSSIPSSTTTGQTNELANFMPPDRMVTYSTHPIPPMGMGVPRSPVQDYYFNKYGA